MARLFFFCLVVMISLGIVSSQGKSNYRRGIRQPRANTQQRAAPECPANISGAVCAECSTLLYCLNGATLQQVKCATNNPDWPYCVNGTCTAEKLEGNADCDNMPTDSSDLVCTFIGYVPDPDDCARYYYCEGVNKPAEPYKCPDGFAYDHSTSMCKQNKTASDCVTIKCEKGQAYSVYEADKSIFGVCDPETNKPTIFRCNDPKNQWFDESSGYCRYVCKKEGSFADNNDKNKYYVCYWVNNKWKMTHEKCPGTQVYDPENPPCKPQ